jgi:hypothetical protein
MVTQKSIKHIKNAKISKLLTALNYMVTKPIKIRYNNSITICNPNTIIIDFYSSRKTVICW